MMMTMTMTRLLKLDVRVAAFNDVNDETEKTIIFSSSPFARLPPSTRVRRRQRTTLVERRRESLPGHQERRRGFWSVFCEEDELDYWTEVLSSGVFLYRVSVVLYVKTK